MEKISWKLNTMPKSDDRYLSVMDLKQVKQARSFHQSFPQYSITPLAELDGMAEWDTAIWAEGLLFAGI